MPENRTDYAREERHILRPREREVVELIHAELSNREIAERLCISVRTVDQHIRAIHEVLGITSRVGLALFWERTAKGEI